MAIDNKGVINGHWCFTEGDVPPSVFTNFQAKQARKYLSFSNCQQLLFVPNSLKTSDGTKMGQNFRDSSLFTEPTSQFPENFENMDPFGGLRQFTIRLTRRFLWCRGSVAMILARSPVELVSKV
jgi:hypothetical protein